MNSRKAFTLIELLVVMAIILVLMGILLPVLSHFRRSAQITGQRADFQTISSALEAYKGDFGDYPRNNVLTSWSINGNDLVAPIRLSLAAALIGPGPQVTQGPGGTGTNIGQYEIGDGADGLGFRGQTTNYQAIISADSLTASPETITVTPIPPQLGTLVPGQTPGSITISVGTPYEETVGFVVDTNTPGQLDLMAGVMYPNNHGNGDKCLIKIGTTKITPNYLPADTFKVAFVPLTAGGGPTTGGAGTPTGIGPAGDAVLLDRWGQVIQYFPSYGPVNNRSGKSVSYASANPSIQAGPLFGYSQPNSIDPTTPYGQYAIWDWRDGAPFFSTNGAYGSWANPVTGSTDTCELWPNPTKDSGSGFQPELAVEWMLGDTSLSNAITAGEKLNWDQPFILISTGPDGPERKDGGYCNFFGPIPASQFGTAFTGNGNIYNFDHP